MSCPRMCQICGEHEWDRMMGTLVVCIDCFKDHARDTTPFDYFDEYPEDDPFEREDS